MEATAEKLAVCRDFCGCLRVYGLEGLYRSMYEAVCALTLKYPYRNSAMAKFILDKYIGPTP